MSGEWANEFEVHPSRGRSSEYISLTIQAFLGDKEEHRGMFFLSRREAYDLAQRLQHDADWLARVQPQPEEAA